MNPPAFQFYPADYLADMKVRMLSWASKGLYMDLLCYCWREGWIPSDASAIAQLCHCHDLAIVEPCLLLFDSHPADEKKLIHKRLFLERQKQIEHSNERSVAGKKGAEARWEKGKKKNGSAIKQPLAKNGSSSSSSSSSLLFPLTPNGGMEGTPSKSKPDTAPSSNEALKICDIFKRRHSTPWTAKEIKSFKAIPRESMADLDLVSRYTLSEQSKGDNGRHRRDLVTFLNNYMGELDRAKAWESKADPQKQTKTNSVHEMGLS